ncbi:hypothetical protein GGS26DRAFT_123092 [Hypomontagnella submonticulosa]|nr:hypothetical protein GGS26DRAFT_123092 [Hypomontagnella submonticulosa]
MDIDNGDEASGGQAQPDQIREILRNIDELVEVVLASNDALKQHDAVTSDGSSLRTRQASLLKEFEDSMIIVRRKMAGVTREVRTILKSDSQPETSQATTDALPDDLIGISQGSEVNRVLARVPLDEKTGYKLRDFATNSPNPQLIVADDDAATALPHNSDEPIVVLQPTLRNVWVVQHAYVRLQCHKSNLIKQYLAAVDPSAGVKKKFSREYYDDGGMSVLPTKSKLGNLLDVKMASHHASHDMMIVLAFKDAEGKFEYMEAVKGDAITVDHTKEYSPYLILPAAEDSIKKLYDTYKALRKATSDQRRVTNDKNFAATLPIDEMAALGTQFNLAGTKEPSGTEGTSAKKRRRILDDEEQIS